MDVGKDGALLPLPLEDDCEVLDVAPPLAPDPTGLVLGDESPPPPPPQEPKNKMAKPAIKTRWITRSSQFSFLFAVKKVKHLACTHGHPHRPRAAPRIQLYPKPHKGTFAMNN
ncbi:MAG: hypothetical protein CMP86_00830 [Gammaproteobacteria bacterium]|nr:hypothetical protein [Gammaproteobacteria bacterium]